jgi:hypothetical protein
MLCGGGNQATPWFGEWFTRRANVLLATKVKKSDPSSEMTPEE